MSIAKQKAELKKMMECRERATPGPWSSMFIGGPMNPRVDVYSVGREGSHHILVKHPDENIKSGFFKKGDAEFIALAGNQFAKIAEQYIEALEVIEFYDSGSAGYDYRTDMARAFLAKVSKETAK